jgi:hypothetical protein
VANFEGCNIHDNTAKWVFLHFEPSVTFHPLPQWKVTRALGWQHGGGLFIKGTATLTDTNVYQNEATKNVRLLRKFEPSRTVHPSSRCE